MGDPVVSSVGEWGRWQLQVMVLLFLVKMPVGWFQLSIIFLEAPRNYGCINDSRLAPNNSTELGLSTENYTTELECDHYEFDTSVFQSTIVSEWQLIGPRAPLSDVTQATLMMGVLAGSFLFGWAADRFGRKKPLMWSILMMASSGAAASLVPWFWVFVFFRFIVAMATGGTMVISIVLGMEILGPRWRATASILSLFGANLGLCAMAAMAFCFREWRHFHAALSVGAAVFLASWCMIPESPRWLLAVGEDEEARRVLEAGARRNGRPVASVSDAVRLYREKGERPQARGRMRDLMATPEIRKSFFLAITSWLFAGLVFYGIHQFVGRLAGDIFINTFFLGAIALPSLVICVVGVRWARRKMIIGSAFTDAALCFALIAVPQGLYQGDALRLTLSGACVVVLNVFYGTLYLFSGELFPTTVRNSAMGWCSMLGRLGSGLAPFVKSLDVYGDLYLMVIYGSAFLMCGLLVMFLPETLGKQLADHVQKDGHKNEQYSKVPLSELNSKSEDASVVTE